MTSNPAGESHLAGDDDYFILDVYVPVRYDDEIVVEVVNNSNEHVYNLVCDVTIDYLLGTKRVIGGVINEQW